VTIAATQLKQQSYLLDQVAEEDIIATKHNRPFAVIVGIDEYNAMKKELENKKEAKAKEALENVIGMLAGKDLPDPVEWQIKFREENGRDDPLA
jgi:prevent-host-death family protein